jgi:hypothetical protein
VGHVFHPGGTINRIRANDYLVAIKTIKGCDAKLILLSGKRKFSGWKVEGAIKKRVELGGN